MPDISIIVPVFNRAGYIGALVESIKRQTFHTFECIIIDDGSTDNTGELCDSLTKDDGRFIVRHTENYGVSHARNLGLELASGQYITFVDSDDILPCNYIKKLMETVTAFKVDLVIGSFCRIFNNPHRIEKITYPVEDRVYTLNEILPEFARLQKQTGVFGRCWAKVFSREQVSDIRFDESLKLAEDFDFYLKMYPRIKTLYFDNTCEYGYVAGAENSTESIPDDEIDYFSQIKIMIRYKEFLENHNSYVGENKRIVSEQLQKHLFFSIYHSRPERLTEAFRKAYELYLFSGIDILEKLGIEGVILKCLKGNCEKRLILIMKTFRLVKKAVKGH